MYTCSFARITWHDMSLDQEKQHKYEQELVRQQEERLAEELDRIRIETERDERVRQQVRQTDPELRGLRCLVALCNYICTASLTLFAELQRKLDAAYVNQERTNQQLHKQRATATARQDDLMTAREMEEARLRAEEEGVWLPLFMSMFSCFAETFLISWTTLGHDLMIGVAERRQEVLHWEESQKYQADLEQQLEDEERRKQQAYEEVLSLSFC